MTEQDETDIRYMRRALQLAAKGASHVSPNPMVGAVIVYRDRIIEEGYHRLFGSWHAEVNAVNSVADKSLLSESTIYVTLEPCSHYGKTPPCSKLLIDMKIPRVVIGSLDPNEKVSGRGVKMLRDAGVDVKVGVLHDECVQLNKHFMLAHSHRRPYVLLKWAQTADNVIGYSDNLGTLHPLQISSGFSRMLMHRERSLFDAILVGANTYFSDTPSLTVRHWHCRQNPLRVVLDPNASLFNHLLNYTPELPLIWAVKKDSHHVGHFDFSKLSSEINVLQLADSEDLLHDLLRQLFERSVSSLMVEGGATTLQHFIDARLFDRIRVEVSSHSAILPDGILPVLAPRFRAKLLSLESHFDVRIFNYSPSKF